MGGGMGGGMGGMGGMPDISSLLNDPEVLAAFQVKQLNVESILVKSIKQTFLLRSYLGPGSSAGFPRCFG